MANLKYFIKECLSRLGLYHPSRGIKIGAAEKASIILSYKKPEHKVFVETGTLNGDMIEAMKNHFDSLYSIELDQELFLKASDRFRNLDKIHLVEGNSATELRKVMPYIQGPALFWLDAHGTGAMTIKNTTHCPAREELEAILETGSDGHTILIDDARHFDRESISVLRSMAESKGLLFTCYRGLFIIYAK